MNGILVADKARCLIKLCGKSVAWHRG